MKTNFAKLNLKNSHTHNQPIKNLIFEPFIIGDDDEQIQQKTKEVSSSIEEIPFEAANYQ